MMSQQGSLLKTPNQGPSRAALFQKQMIQNPLNFNMRNSSVRLVATKTPINKANNSSNFLTHFNKMENNVLFNTSSSYKKSNE
jgi:hypothetical protein